MRLDLPVADRGQSAYLYQAIDPITFAVRLSRASTGEWMYPLNGIGALICYIIWFGPAACVCAIGCYICLRKGLQVSRLVSAALCFVYVAVTILLGCMIVDHCFPFSQRVFWFVPFVYPSIFTGVIACVGIWLIKRLQSRGE